MSDNNKRPDVNHTSEDILTWINSSATIFGGNVIQLPWLEVETVISFDELLMEQNKFLIKRK